MGQWTDLVLRSCRAHRVWVVAVEGDGFPLWRNPAINRAWVGCCTLAAAPKPPFLLLLLLLLLASAPQHLSLARYQAANPARRRPLLLPPRRPCPRTPQGN